MDQLHFVNAFSSGFAADYEDFFTGDPASDVVSLKNYQNCLFLVHKGAGAAGTVTFTVEACDDVTPNNTTAQAFDYKTCTSGDTFSAPAAATAAAGFISTAGADQMYAIEVDADALPAGYPMVRLQCTEVDSTAVDGGGIAILGYPRYAADIMPTAIA